MADFHVLRAVGENVYGYDAAAKTLLASIDGGKTWEARVPQGDVFDLVMNPDDPSQLLVSTHSRLATSEDGGRTWETLGPERALLAWPAARTLYVVGTNGETFVSADGGWSLTPRGSLDGAPTAVSAVTDGSLYVALEDGTLRVSDDGGTTWRVESGITR
jgi:photosystem II stability/assembly factor-like uncharacterized protein